MKKVNADALNTNEATPEAEMRLAGRAITSSRIEVHKTKKETNHRTLSFLNAAFLCPRSSSIPVVYR
jgi:hypothetical protein